MTFVTPTYEMYTVPAVAMIASGPELKKPANAAGSISGTPRNEKAAMMSISVPTRSRWKTAVFLAPRALTTPKRAAKPTAIPLVSRGLGSRYRDT